MTARDVRSDTTGDEGRFLPLAELERALAAMPPAPRDAGTVSLLVVRNEDHGRRETPHQAYFCTEAGVTGDAWRRDTKRELDAQVAVMQADVAAMLANGQPLTLFGDNLFLRLDLSTANLPAGSRVRAGAALLEVTAMPHDGCRKFRGRFGGDALRLVAGKELRHRNLRGIYMRVLEPGHVRVGDDAQVISRPA